MRKVTVTLAPKELLSHFQILNTKSGGDQIELPNTSRVFIPDFDREISVAEMEEVFNRLKENKAPGDGIPPGVFKALDSTLIEILTILFIHVEDVRDRFEAPKLPHTLQDSSN